MPAEFFTGTPVRQKLRLIAVGDPVPDDVASFVESECQRPSVRAYLDHPRPPHAPG
jgi:hypothetical protein